MLDRLDGDETLCREIIGDFRQDIPIQMKRLAKALMDGDVPLATLLAHTIKGAATNVEVRVLRNMAHEMEIAGNKKDLARAVSLNGNLRREFETLTGVLDRAWD